MERPVRIGIAGLEDQSLLDELSTLPSRPEHQTFPDLFGEADAIVHADLDVLVLGAPADSTELGGALRVLRSLAPGLGLIVAASDEREVELLPICRRSQARWLRLPLHKGALAAALEQALVHSDRPSEEVFLDLARGFADEVNNPLMFLSGHLQLLQVQLGDSDPDVIEQVRAAMEGTTRIQRSVERIRLVSRAALGPRSREDIDLDLVLNQALTDAAKAVQNGDVRDGLTSAEAASNGPTVVREPTAGPFRISGERQVLEQALTLFAQVGCELHRFFGEVHFELTRVDAAIRLRLLAAGPAVADWRLPRSFEPYYLNRLLNGTAHGLSLFLLQTAVHAHGGQATARRMPSGALALDVQLPSR